MTEESFEKARRVVGELDAVSARQFHIQRDEDPREALVKVRALLCGSVGREDDDIALVVVYLDRVLDTLREFEVRTIYERRR